MELEVKKPVIHPTDLFEAGAVLIRACNEAEKHGAFTRNHDDPYYIKYRNAVEDARWYLNQGLIQAETAAALPNYAKSLGWV